ncbi:MAG: TetR/AcrR family transcriptional regulator [Vampirovibrionales bacterium]
MMSPRKPSQKTESKKRHTKQVLIDVGLELMSYNGFHKASLEEILTTAKVPKGSFYYYFKSKEAFGTEVLEQYWERKIAWATSFLERQDVSPLNRLRLICWDVMQQMKESKFEMVCMASRMSQELNATNEGFQACLQKGHYTRQKMLEIFFEKAKAAGEVPQDLSITYLVEAYQTYLDGAMFESKLTQSLRPFQTMHWLFFECLCKPQHKLSPEIETSFQLDTKNSRFLSSS